MERRKKTHRDINDCHRLALQSIRRVMPDCYQSNNKKKTTTEITKHQLNISEIMIILYSKSLFFFL